MILFLLFFYFFLMLFLNFFAAGWIMELIYREAGITKREADQYRREHITGGRMQDQNRRALYWLESRSKNPARVRRLAYLHNLALLPSVLLIPATFVCIATPSIPSDVHNIVLICVMAFLPVYNASLAIAGVLYKKKKTDKSAANPLAEDDTYTSGETEYDASEEQDYFAEAERKKEEDAFFPELVKERRKSKRRIAFILTGTALLAGLAVLAVFLVPQFTAAPKTPATAGQAAAALAAQGYEPQYTDSFDDALTESVTVQSENFFFDFYTCRDKDSAVRLYDSACSQREAFAEEYQAAVAAEKKANYAVYTWRSAETYAVVMRVDSTVLCGECPVKDEAVLNQILHTIGYL